MKIRSKILGSVFALSLWNSSLIATESCSKTIPVGWLDHREVHISDGAFYIHTNLGRVELKVLDFDEEKDSYLVECIKYGECFYPIPEETD